MCPAYRINDFGKKDPEAVQAIDISLPCCREKLRESVLEDLSYPDLRGTIQGNTCT
jgi:hypothetical protein